MSRNLLTGLVGAWCPSLGPSGYTLLDRSGLGTHLTWTSPSATNWQADSISGWAASTTDSGDFIASTRRIPTTVQGWSVVHWVKARSVAGFANSIDLNRGVYSSGNVGPRCELSSDALWVYSANTSSTSVTTLHSSGTTLPSTGIWWMLAITHDGNVTSKTYQQGIPSGLSQTNLNGATGGFVGSFEAPRLGQGSSDANRGFDGLLGASLVFARQLSDAEVWQLWLQGPQCRLLTQRRRRVYGIPATAVRPYLFLNRGQVIGGGIR